MYIYYPSLFGFCKNDPDGKLIQVQQIEHEIIKDLFSDFLRSLRCWIEKEVAESHGYSIKTTPTEYLFSTPTTWDARVVAQFLDCINKAGYADKEYHTAKISLTEAHAAALYTTLFPTIPEKTTDGRKQGSQVRYYLFLTALRTPAKFPSDW